MTNRRVADLTVAVSTMERPRSLARCLDALLSGDVLPREIIVVDQGADPATRAEVEGRRRADVAVRYVRQTARGLSASRNVAVALASYPVLATTDDDCVPIRSWVATIEQAFASAGAPDAVTGRVLPLESGEPGLFAVSTRTSTRRAEFSGRVEPWHCGTGGNFAARREAILRVGGFDERLGAGSAGGAAEDMDLLYRLARSGARIRYEPDSVVLHACKSWSGLLASHAGYGRGMGAFCAIRCRDGDMFVLYLLLLWVGHHVKRAIRAALIGESGAVADARGMLGGTAAGLLYGVRVADREPLGTGLAAVGGAARYGEAEQRR